MAEAELGRRGEERIGAGSERVNEAHIASRGQGYTGVEGLRLLYPVVLKGPEMLPAVTCVAERAALSGAAGSVGGIVHQEVAAAITVNAVQSVVWQ